MSRALDIKSSNTIEFTDFVVCFSITSFGDLNEKIKLAFRIYDLGMYIYIDFYFMMLYMVLTPN